MVGKGKRGATLVALLGAVVAVAALVIGGTWIPFLGAAALIIIGGAVLMFRDPTASTFRMLTLIGWLVFALGCVLFVVTAPGVKVTDPQLTLFLHTLLNGFQFGIFLFLVAAGLSLVLGIMNMVNLAHGSLFMFGAFFAARTYGETGSFYWAVAVALPLTLLLGIVLEKVVIQFLYERDHMMQVLATFGLILFFNETVILVFGVQSLPINRPDALTGSVSLFGAPYPAYRLMIDFLGLAVAAAIFLLITRTKIGMLIRAGASNRPMAGALGVNIALLFTLVFGLGAMLAGLAGVMAGPVEDVFPGMGEAKLILAIVVIVIGGIGSIRGAFIAALIVGLVEASGRTFMTDVVRYLSAQVLAWEPFEIDELAQTAGPAISSMIIYILMAAILFFRPQGLFPARSG
jgi:branched-chain amino acid transport system permease protein